MPRLPLRQPTVPAGQTRSEKAIKGGPLRYWADRDDQAQVLAATFIGGKGHEWLSAGGFQPDGSIILCGNVCGGEFNLGLPEVVLGSDGSRPAAATFGKHTEGRREVADIPGWTRTDATGFVVRCTSDLQKITSVSRLPWTSAAITACEIAPDGSIYIAGRASAGIAALGGQQ